MKSGLACHLCPPALCKAISIAAPAAKLYSIYHLPKMMANPANADQPVTSIKLDAVQRIEFFACFCML
jgi:hypothetical protein